MLKLIRRSATVMLLPTLVAGSGLRLHAQQPAPVPVARLVAEPASLTLEVGQTLPVKLTAYDAAGQEIAEPAVRVSAPRNALRLTRSSVTGLAAGSYEIVVTAMAPSGNAPVTLS